MSDTMLDEEACLFFDLPPIATTSILKRLSDQPQDILSFGRTCRAAHALASDPALWQQLCCTFSSTFQDPHAWHARGFQHLYLALVHPFRDLLRCRLWHSNLWPCGCVLRIDAEPPQLVARSLHYKTLNGGPYCHEVVFVELHQSAAGQPPTQGKAAAYLSEGRGVAEEQQQQLQQLDADHSHSRLVKLLPHPGDHAAAPAAAPSTTAAVDVEASPGLLAAGFVLGEAGVRTSATYMALHESLVRYSQQRIKPYAQVAQQQGGSSTGTGSSSAGVQQLPLPDVTPTDGISPHTLFDMMMTLFDIVGEARAKRATLHRPVFRPFRLQPWLRLAGSSSNVLQPALCTDSTAAAAAADDDASLIHLLPGLFKGAYGAHGIELVQLQLAAVPAAGPRLGANSSSANIADAAITAAVFMADSRDETPRLRLGVLLQGLTGLAGQPEAGPLDTTSSEDVFAAGDAFDVEEDEEEAMEDEEEVLEDADSDEHVEINQGAASDPESDVSAEFETGSMSEDENGAHVEAGDDQAAAAAAAAAQQEAAAAVGAAMQAVVGAALGEAAAAAVATDISEQPPAPNLLLVGTKVLGDVNVPAGHVTFAFDVSSRSLQGARQLLQLPPNVSSRVDLARPGARQLWVQERYRGRAQIASTGFQHPCTIQAELLVFALDCFGVLWGAPLNMLSLFSRVEDAVTLPAAAGMWSARH